MSKRKYDKVEVKNLSGDGKKWCRGPMIGSSSSGLIFLATLKRRRSPDRIIADRLCRPVMAVKSTRMSNSFTLLEEKMVLDDLQECPYIRRIFGEETTVGMTGEEAYNILLEYPSGGTLEDLIKRSGSEGLPENEVWHYTRCLLLGLHHMHSHGYVHRNLKPENIMLVRWGVGCMAKIGEYESVIRVEMLKKRLWNPYTRMDIKYLSPEAFGSMQQGQASDIWAVGCIFYEMLTGKCIWDNMDKGYSEIKDDLCEMKNGSGIRMKLPNGMSKNAKKFLKACFQIKAENRWSADRLLNLSFLASLQV
ncbi:hypothetical protein BUALT_Bualt01G0118300 [Buddleja alternifolia]|uniref:Protein kinase domain-containing protein n=1 Tax=Buddleja alternifolia TaxID=168488 RepID=A0AAV6YGU5_9LAMI|nr:hypothetical protein BUALT_Bualt01G0118300 [Buddleja alternifolia]